ncbi:hypothetical protein BBOH_0112 [Bifidobacterium bohemicum DSM 22767]|uniref:Uncharacterized protein n=1 Tax=Bifidobacterium bohemicum DSM 22767 TaxID=1437606 RepID=A0A086ZJE0_9BIFI|nr:hypothetical protein BBOH_0112 [Bifidobacterium bohemicum DSM 22767]
MCLGRCPIVAKCHTMTDVHQVIESRMFAHCALK